MRVRLKAGQLALGLRPEIGGSIAGFEYAGQPILRRCGGETVLDSACFPIVPYVNRIRGGSFSFRGRQVRIRPNMAGDPSPLHGEGWLSWWTVEAADDAQAVLSFHHEAGEWPWDYEARQECVLDSRVLSVGLICRNLSREPMPCGLGQHPYFPCGAETRLDTTVTHAWTVDEHVLPVEKVVADGRYDLRERRVCGQDLDNGFGGWSGEARMGDPDWPYELRLSSPEAKFFQVYSPTEGGIFVAEPVTHANAALNEPESEWPKLGMRVLAPGEEMSLDMRLDVIPK
jgi:aldose 1-epimerase